MRSPKNHPFGILMYHRVADRVEGAAQPTWNVQPRLFRKQLEGLLSRGYRAWPLRRAIEHRIAGEPIPARTFVVTFDDGYECVYRNAWPILKSLSIPATIFIATAYLDADRPFDSDDWKAAGSPGVRAETWRSLSTAQCLEMMNDGSIEIGSHTHTHADFRGQPQAFLADLARSLIVLRESFGLSHPSFAFPFGYHDPDMVAAAREAGVACAVTSRQDLVLPCDDPHSMGRFAVMEHHTATMLILKLSRLQTTLRRLWRSMARNKAEALHYPDFPRQHSPSQMSPHGAAAVQ